MAYRKRHLALTRTEQVSLGENDTYSLLLQAMKVKKPEMCDRYRLGLKGLLAM